MPAGKYDITIEQGATFRRNLTVRREGVLQDFTGWTFAAKMRAQYSSASAMLTFDVNVISLTGGVIQLYAAATATAALPTYDPPNALVGYWDLELTDPGSGDIIRLLEGCATIRPEATK
jgi:hypothetical protein